MVEGVVATDKTRAPTIQNTPSNAMQPEDNIQLATPGGSAIVPIQIRDHPDADKSAQATTNDRL